MARYRKIWALPWRGEQVPHAVVDIIRECNISCRACYNNCAEPQPKALDEIERELDIMQRRRRLSSVSIAGGEVFLHPRLMDIIRMIKSRGIGTELLTNGLNVGAEACKKLKDAGLDILFFHIERGQKRPDLPDRYSASDVNALRKEKVIMAHKAGLTVGLTSTVYPAEYDDVHDIITLTLEMPEIEYLLLTLYRDNSGIELLHGDVSSGFRGEGCTLKTSANHNNAHIAQWVEKEFGLEPFAAMGSNVDKGDPRWMSYFVGAVYAGDEHFYESLKPSLLEKAAMTVFRLAGKYPMHIKQSASILKKQLVLNGVFGGRLRSNMKLVKKAERPDAHLMTKRILFHNLAELTEDGRLVYCRWCPDAVIKNGKLVPVCVADYVSDFPGN